MRALAILAALAGCAHEQRLFGEKLPPGCATDGKTAESERCTGWILDRLMIKTHYHAYPDPELAAYVTDLGTRIARAAGDRGQWTFRVLDDPTAQAFVNLGRIVYVNRGAIAAMRDEAELAALLAHEIAHLLAAHERETFAEASRGVTRWGDEHALAVRYARDDEIQADELAVKFVAAAGYDVTAVERMLRALGALAPRSGGTEESRHPAWTERIARVQAMAARLPHGGARNAAALRPHLARLVVGQDPRRAAISGRAILFGRVGIALDRTPGSASIDDDGNVAISVDAAAIQLRVFPAEVASYFAAHPGDGMIAAQIPAGASTLVVLGAGPGAAAHVQRIAASVRPLRPDERARLRPRLLDLSAPRPLWPAVASIVMVERRSAP